MKQKVFWINADKEMLTADEVDNDYLKHIMYFVADGCGWKWFVDKDVINNIFEEAYKRNAFRADVVFLLHLKALYTYGYSERKPRYLVDWEGNYCISY